MLELTSQEKVLIHGAVLSITSAWQEMRTDEIMKSHYNTPGFLIACARVALLNNRRGNINDLKIAYIKLRLNTSQWDIDQYIVTANTAIFASFSRYYLDSGSDYLRRIVESIYRNDVEISSSINHYMFRSVLSQMSNSFYVVPRDWYITFSRSIKESLELRQKDERAVQCSRCRAYKSINKPCSICGFVPRSGRRPTVGLTDPGTLDLNFMGETLGQLDDEDMPT